jgi:hypothetical protein
MVSPFKGCFPFLASVSIETAVNRFRRDEYYRSPRFCFRLAGNQSAGSLRQCRLSFTLVATGLLLFER